ncbi:hypothetical protein [Rhizobium terrae]|uniref:hypothetical protein n=1 Tax=Rhizobium terrae TaxID=2171756 RepID=UPI000E3B7F52|nr:hypothetical protein [Rhizobium terrae]
MIGIEQLRLFLFLSFGILVGIVSVAIASLMALPFTPYSIASHMNGGLPITIGERLYMLATTPAISVLIHMAIGKFYFSAKGEGPYGPPRPKSRRRKYHEPKRIVPWIPTTSLISMFLVFCWVLLSGLPMG